MVDTAHIDTRLELLGQQLSSPIVIAPVGSQRAFHPEGELATARAARSRDHLQILSNVTTTSIEDVIAARGAPVWSQLYPTFDWAVAEKMIRRATSAVRVVGIRNLKCGGKRAGDSVHVLPILLTHRPLCCARTWIARGLRIIRESMPGS